MERNSKGSFRSKFSLDLMSATSLASLAAVCFITFIASKFLHEVVIIYFVSAPDRTMRSVGTDEWKL